MTIEVYTKQSVDELLAQQSEAIGLLQTDVEALQDRRWLIKTSNYQAQVGDRIVANGSAGGFTVTLPTNATPGDEVHVLALGTNAIAVDPAGANLNGATAIAPFTISTDRQETHFIYVGAAGWVAAVGGGTGSTSGGGSTPTPTPTGYLAEAQAVIDAILATGATLTTNQKQACNDRISAFKTNGIWNKLIAYYGFLGGSAASHAINWKSPGTYNLVWNGNVSHSTSGSTGDGASGYASTGIPMSMFNAQDTSLASYIQGGSGTVTAGAQVPGVKDQLFLITGDNIYRSAQGSNNQGNNADARFSGPLNSGLFVGSSIGGDIGIYRNGLNVTSSKPSGVPTNYQFVGTNPILVMTFQDGPNSFYSFSSACYQSFSVGFGLTDSQISAYYLSEQAYQSALDRHV